MTLHVCFTRHSIVEGAAVTAVGIRSRETRSAAGKPAVTLYGGESHAVECNLAAVFAGRLDDRDALAKSLGSKASTPTAQLILRAYRRWGKDCPGFLTGEFLWVIWDITAAGLLCARDIAGISPAFFTVNETHFRLSDDLVRLVSGTSGVNHGFLGETLTLLLTSQDETPFTGIHRLPPAHWLWVDQQDWRVGAYWQPGSFVALPAPTAADAQAEFEQAINSAVTDRRAGAGRNGILLSGGLDSTLIAAAASDRLSEQRPLPCYSLCFSGQPWDEDAHIAKLEGSLPLTVCRIDAANPQWPDWDQLALRSALPPEYPTVVLLSRLMATAATQGVTLMMSGEGGDNWFLCDGNSYSDYVRHGLWSSVRHLLRHDFARGGISYILRQAARDFFWPVTPAAIRRWYLGRAVTGGGWPLLDPDFVRITALPRRLAAVGDAYHCRSLGLARRVQVSQIGLSSWVCETLARTARFSGVAWSAPLLDRRLIEFALRTPLHVLMAPGRDRMCHRRMLARLLPTTAWHRQDKADLKGVYFGVLRSPEVVETLLDTRRRDWVDADALTRRIDRLMASPLGSDIANWRTLWGLFAVEVWYRTHFGTGRRATAANPASPAVIPCEWEELKR